MAQKKTSKKKSATKKKASTKKKVPASQGGPAAELPHADEIEQAFGVDKKKFDVRARHGAYKPSSIGNEAKTAQLGAQAFTTGNEAAFKVNPDLHTAAHEAAHVVQQRGN